MKTVFKIKNSKAFSLLRWLFSRCDYCGYPIAEGGGRRYRGGTPHYVYPSLKNGMPSKKEKLKYACLRCEMEFDEDQQIIKVL